MKDLESESAPHHTVNEAFNEAVASSSAACGSSEPRAPLPAPPARVLLALHGERSPERALRFAERLARSLTAELHVLRVVRPVASAGRGDAGDSLIVALREAQRALAAARRTRALCDTVLSESLPSPRLRVRVGAFVEQAAGRAEELGATLIAVSETKSPLAATVIRLARKADLPVIVARGRANFHTLLAATDLEDGQVPLLRKALQLGRELEASVVAVHGVLDTQQSAHAATLEARVETLEQVTRFLDTPFTRVVARSADPVTCIIEQARAHDAGLLVVGVRPRLDRAHPSTAAMLLKSARYPVMVAPLGALSQHG